MFRITASLFKKSSISYLSPTGSWTLVGPASALHYRQCRQQNEKKRDHFQKTTLELDKITLRCSYFLSLGVKRDHDEILKKRKLTYLETTNKKKNNNCWSRYVNNWKLHLQVEYMMSIAKQLKDGMPCISCVDITTKKI